MAIVRTILTFNMCHLLYGRYLHRQYATLFRRGHATLVIGRCQPARVKSGVVFPIRMQHLFCVLPPPERQTVVPQHTQIIPLTGFRHENLPPFFRDTVCQAV